VTAGEYASGPNPVQASAVPTIHAKSSDVHNGFSGALGKSSWNGTSRSPPHQTHAHDEPVHCFHARATTQDGVIDPVRQPGFDQSR